MLMVSGYLDVLAAIAFSREAWRRFKGSKETSRKLPHILAGDLAFLIPLFENRLSPASEIHKEIKGFLTNKTGSNPPC
jgi:hypothetical protein